jgi:hypothetical protein
MIIYGLPRKGKLGNKKFGNKKKILTSFLDFPTEHSTHSKESTRHPIESSADAADCHYTY